jgi:hypothetical protein
MCNGMWSGSIEGGEQRERERETRLCSLVFSRSYPFLFFAFLASYILLPLTIRCHRCCCEIYIHTHTTVHTHLLDSVYIPSGLTVALFL